MLYTKTNNKNLNNSEKKYNARNIIVDVAVSIIIATVVYYYCSVFFEPLKPFLYHNMDFLLLYPAIFFASGHGMGTANIDLIPGLADFFYHGAPCFEVANIQDYIEVSPIETSWQLVHINLFYAVGWIWRIFGVSKDALIMFSHIMASISSIILYLVFRMFMSRVASAVATLIVCTSPAMLIMSPQTRDFGKVPFFWGLLLIILLLIIRPMTKKQLFALSCIGGLFLGIGVGFRQDLTMGVPLTILSLFFFAKVKNTQHPFRMRLVAIVIFIVFFLPFSRPVLRGMALESGNVSAHTILMGLAPNWGTALGIGNASYEMLVVSDAGPYAQANAYARRKGYSGPMVHQNSAEYLRLSGDMSAPLIFDPFSYFTGATYGAYGKSLVRSYMWTFPADFVISAWQSVISVNGASFRIYKQFEKFFATSNKVISPVIYFGVCLSKHISKYGIVYVIIVLLGASLFYLRLTIYITGILLFFCGYPSINFLDKHLFYLSIIPIGAIIICINQIIKLSLFLMKKENRLKAYEIFMCPMTYIKIIRNGFFYILLLVSLFALPLLVLRAWQTSQVSALADRLSSISLQRVAICEEQQNDRVLIFPQDTLPGLVDAQSLPLDVTAWEYVAVVFDTHGQDIPLRINYGSYQEFTQDITIQGVDDRCVGRVTLYFPIYESASDYYITYHKHVAENPLEHACLWYKISTDPDFFRSLWRRTEFIGLSFPKQYMDSFVGFYHAEDIEFLDFLPFFQLPEDRRFLRPYKTRSLALGEQSTSGTVIRDTLDENQ